ncbi:MAG: hypothetical protein A2663_04450 [Candidatus Buchananbacteria bacterium RIFCSPHIGHO2_01_FULL_46_12]|uniref:HTH cro/C1-type domain-containing protein n=2 Tax=Candidatus Buchananiibacteriota TaxID=1817903 RepID=A0A1G1Y2W1_9BACT|nr:MAG: hypothetical protein A2663_04450 [Candidatus Buchananbacteria bacterium RIFCSPHIGHO2_01_FULL_46_12]OGY52890.1 MAG: hypothetical protein A3B15_01835 [Candidatus Buchananbacteria bacterium RIFCSPLOWO2_01_FULL_45_31]
MVGFKTKTIVHAQKLGESLKEARRKKNLTLAAAGDALNIPFKYLAAIEEGEYQKLPGEIYAKNFLKAYANLLDLNPKNCLALYQSEYEDYTRKKPLDDFKKPVMRISGWHLLATPKIVRGLFIGFLALACLGYLGFKIKAIMTPPDLTVETPLDNLITSQNFITLTGRVEKDSTLQINGQPVLIDEDGKFEENIDLRPGLNVIEVLAQTRHGRQTKVYRNVILKELE